MLWISAALALLAGKAIANSAPEAVTEPPAIVPGAYIVEYEGDQVGVFMSPDHETLEQPFR